MIINFAIIVHLLLCKNVYY